MSSSAGMCGVNIHKMFCCQSAHNPFTVSSRQEATYVYFFHCLFWCNVCLQAELV